MLIIYLLCSLLFANVAADAIDTSKLFLSPSVKENVAPDPIALKYDWWTYFEVPDEELKEHIDIAEAALQKIPPKLSAENQEKAKTLVEKIILNLNAYLQIRTTAPPSPLESPVITANYTIANIVDLNRELRRRTIEIQAAKEDRKDKQRQIDASQNQLDKLIQAYQKANSHSEEQVLLGLNIILYKSAIEMAKKSVSYLDKSIDLQSRNLKEIKDVLNASAQHLVSSPQEVEHLSELMTAAEKNWDQALNSLKIQEDEEITGVSGITGEKADAKNQLLAQLLMQSRIKEAIAHNQWISFAIEYTISNLALEPAKVSSSTLNDTMASWKQTIADFKDHLQEWTIQSQRQIQRYGQTLSLIGTENTSTTKELLSIQQQIIEVVQANLLLLQRFSSEIDDTTFLYQLLTNTLSSSLTTSQRWLYQVVDFFSGIYESITNWINTTLFHVSATPITFLGIVRFLLILIATIWISRLTLGALARITERRKGIHKSVIYRINRLIHYTILTVGILLALSSIGFDFSSLLLVAGALGIGLGFGLQSIFNNFISGIIILFESQLKVGDFIELESGIRGEIREINVRSTIVTTNDGTDVVIPNAEIVSNKIINWTLKDPYRRVHIPFTVAFGTDKELVAKIVVEAAKNVPMTLSQIGTPQPVVYMTKFGATGLDMELAVWVNEKYTRHTHSTFSTYLWAIDTALNEHGIQIPYPRRDIHIEKVMGKESPEDLWPNK